MNNNRQCPVCRSQLTSSNCKKCGYQQVPSAAPRKNSRSWRRRRSSAGSTSSTRSTAPSNRTRPYAPSLPNVLPPPPRKTKIIPAIIHKAAQNCSQQPRRCPRPTPRPLPTAQPNCLPDMEGLPAPTEGARPPTRRHLQALPLQQAETATHRQQEEARPC